MNALISPFNARWEVLVAEFLEAKKSPETLQTFVNTIGWWGDGEEINIDQLEARAEEFSIDNIPKEVRWLTCGVDVQLDRLELAGIQKTTYSFLTRIQFGVHHTNQPLGNSWITFLTRNGRLLFIVGVENLKSRIHTLIAGQSDIRFSNTLEGRFYEELASEKRQVRYKMGRPILEWIRLGNRPAESLDCLVYAMAVKNLIFGDPAKWEIELRAIRAIKNPPQKNRKFVQTGWPDKLGEREMMLNLYACLKKFGMYPLIFIIATTLFLSGCGGGSTSNEVVVTPEKPAEESEPPTTTNSLNIYQSADDKMTQRARDSAESEPVYGSVSQLSGRDPNSVMEITRSDNGENYYLTLPTANDSSISLNSEDDLEFEDDEEDEDTAWGLFKGDSNNATLVVFWTPAIDDPGPWIAGGYWIHGSGFDIEANTIAEEGISEWEIGAFVDGPRIEIDPHLPTGGTAEYFGVARGVYVATAGNDFYNEGSNIVGSYEGDFQATAEFENGGGNISGEVIIVTSNDYLVNTATRTIDLFKNTIFTWNDLEFTSDGQATGDVTVSFPGLVS